LLRPFDWINIKDKLSEISKEEIISLINEAQNIFEKDKSLIQVRSPCKIFGNLFGQYSDLMRFFSSFGNPSETNQMGDIYIMNYIFLGNCIDLGFESLEVIFLLIALKVKYPNNIYLIRGNHEDINVNSFNGLSDECKEKLNDNIKSPDSIFMKLNNLFNYFPLGITIDQHILCVHSGIGNNIKSISEIENINRPVNIDLNDKDNIVNQLLYSDCQENENPMNYKIYSKNHLNEFMSNNKLELLITSHKFINEGIKSFYNDKLIVVNSATDFLDKYENIGGMLNVAKKTVKRPIQIIPKLINVFKEEKGNKFRKIQNPSVDLL
jgi:protein phosphatase